MIWLEEQITSQKDLLTLSFNMYDTITIFQYVQLVYQLTLQLLMVCIFKSVSDIIDYWSAPNAVFKIINFVMCKIIKSVINCWLSGQVQRIIATYLGLDICCQGSAICSQGHLPVPYLGIFLSECPSCSFLPIWNHCQTYLSVMWWDAAY